MARVAGRSPSGAARSGLGSTREAVVRGTIQAKLALNRPGDELEQEADRVSERVMRMAAPPASRECSCGCTCPKCRRNDGEAGVERLLTKQARAGGPVPGEAPPIVHEALGPAGRPL